MTDPTVVILPSAPDRELCWVHRVNQLCREIDEIAASIHPSAWPEALADLHEKYRRLAKSGMKEASS